MSFRTQFTSFDSQFSAIPEPVPEPIAESSALAKRYTEDVGYGWPYRWSNDPDNIFGGNTGLGSIPLGGAAGTTNDRKAGRDIPIYWNEIDLRGFRVLSRHLCDTNDFAIGFLGLLVNYNVRKGYGWQACRKGEKKSAYSTSDGEVTDPAVKKGQTILDEFRDKSLWPLTSREAFRRWRRDGEVFGRLFQGAHRELPIFRFVEPEQVGSPTGDTDSPTSFGLFNRPGDVTNVQAVYIRDMDGNGLDGRWITTRRSIDPESLHELSEGRISEAVRGNVVHLKANVDSTVKRGVPDFFSVDTALRGVSRLLTNMLDTATEQAAIVWREGFPTATVGQVQSLLPQAGATRQSWEPSGWFDSMGGNGLYPTAANNRFRSRTILRTEGNRIFEPGPTSTGIPNYVQVMQAMLRACCVRWGLPEYASGDASNNNFASATVAGGLFPTTVEGTQLEFGTGWEKEIALRVLDSAVEAGLMTQEERAVLDVEIVPPAVVTPDPTADSQRVAQLVQAKLLSPQTAQLQLQLDPRHEAENWKAWNQQQAAQQQQGQQPPDKGNGPGGSGPSPDDSLGGGLPTLESIADAVTRRVLEAVNAVHLSKFDSLTAPDLELATALLVALKAAGADDDADELAHLMSDPDAGDELVRYLSETDEAQESDRKVGETWPGRSGRWFTKKQDGRVVPARDPSKKDEPKPARTGPTPQEKAKSLAAAREPARQAARDAYAKARTAPHELTHADIPALVEHLNTLTRDELREHARASAKKLGGLKAELVQRLVGKIAGEKAAADVWGELKAPPEAAETPGAPGAKEHLDAYRQAKELMNTPGRAIGGVRMKQDVIRAVAKQKGFDDYEAEAWLENGGKADEPQPASKAPEPAAPTPNTAVETPDASSIPVVTTTQGKTAQGTAAKAVAKEPHEMTKADYVAEKVKKTGSKSLSWMDRKSKEDKAKDDAEREWDAANEAAFIQGKKTAEKPEWAKTGVEWANHPAGPGPMTSHHKGLVQAALAAGKPVPPEVLADYPDLAAKQAKPAAAEPTPAEQPKPTAELPRETPALALHLKSLIAASATDPHHVDDAGVEKIISHLKSLPKTQQKAAAEAALGHPVRSSVDGLERIEGKLAGVRRMMARQNV